MMTQNTSDDLANPVDVCVCACVCVCVCVEVCLCVCGGVCACVWHQQLSSACTLNVYECVVDVYVVCVCVCVCVCAHTTPRGLTL